MTMIRAGLAELDITPPLGSDMPGQFHSRYASGILDPLYVKALVLENDGYQVALIAVDGLWIPFDIVRRVRSGLEKRLGISESIVGATHSHTGGPIGSWGDHTHDDAAYVDLVVSKSVDAAALAAANLTAVRFRIGREREDGISFIRRFIMKDGKQDTNPGILNPDIVKPAGEIDPEVISVRIEDLDGHVVGFLTNFACHPDVVGGDKVSADYMGELSRVLKKTYGEHIVSVFYNGACGNINHLDAFAGRFISGEYDEAHYKRMGRVLAGKAIAATEKAPAKTYDVLSAASEAISYPVRQMSVEQAEAGRTLAASERRSNAELFAQDEKQLVDLFYAKQAVWMYEHPQAEQEILITAIRMGDLAIASNPAELFVEYGLKLKEHSPAPYTMVAELSNGSIGYVTTPDAIASGGYESRLCSSAKMASGAGDAIADTGARLIEKLFG
ncbi:hypothetical protein AGMMS49992_19910 [Clostridia bacterium]|nr:hypothetical protein AGMMS49992_19910 [Clostridia bacterium]